MIKKSLTLFGIFTALVGIIFGLNSNPINHQNDKVLSLSATKTTANSYLNIDFDDPVVFAALPSFDQEIKTSIKTADARSEIIRQYLNK